MKAVWFGSCSRWAACSSAVCAKLFVRSTVLFESCLFEHRLLGCWPSFATCRVTPGGLHTSKAAVPSMTPSTTRVASNDTDPSKAISHREDGIKRCCIKHCCLKHCCIKDRGRIRRRSPPEAWRHARMSACYAASRHAGCSHAAPSHAAPSHAASFHAAPAHAASPQIAYRFRHSMCLMDRSPLAPANALRV